MNVCFLIGHVGRDPEIRSTNAGARVANFTLATNERYKDKNGERQEKTNWHDCVAWGSLVNTIEQYVKKGTGLAIIGQIQKRIWEDRDGKKRVQVEINIERLEFMGGDRGRDNEGDEDDRPHYRRKSSPPKRGTDIPDDLDDMIPF